MVINSVNSTIKCGIAGLIHDHVWNYLDKALTIPNFKITCIADVNESCRKKAADKLELGDSACYDNWHKMLYQEQIDVCLCFTDTLSHGDVVEACAKRGIHVMVEKPMAVNVKEADRMIKACKKSEVMLMVNFPFAFNPYVIGCYELIKSGKLGDPLSMRWRGGHRGPKEIGCSSYFCDWLYDKEKNGGGALMDFGVYGAVLFAWYFGRPDRISAIVGYHKDVPLEVEDHAIITLQYSKEKKVMGTIEATWSQPGGMEIHINCKDGAIANNPFMPDSYKFKVGNKTWEDANFPVIPEGRHGCVPYFISCIRQQKKMHGIFTPDVNRIAIEILDAAKESMRTGKIIEL